MLQRKCTLWVLIQPAIDSAWMSPPANVCWGVWLTCPGSWKTNFWHVSDELSTRAAPILFPCVDTEVNFCRLVSSGALDFGGAAHPPWTRARRRFSSLIFSVKNQLLHLLSLKWQTRYAHAFSFDWRRNQHVFHIRPGRQGDYGTRSCCSSYWIFYFERMGEKHPALCTIKEWWASRWNAYSKLIRFINCKIQIIWTSGETAKTQVTSYFQIFSCVMHSAVDETHGFVFLRAESVYGHEGELCFP